MLDPVDKNCKQCHTTWPCPTVKIIAEASGSPVPEPVRTEKEYYPHHDVRPLNELQREMESEVHTRMMIGPVY